MNQNEQIGIRDEQLMELAVSAMKRSYSPYSGFRVGAAVLCGDGRVFLGCNIENASYSLCVCAERCAVFKAVSEGASDIVAIAIAGGRDGEVRGCCPPCGSCRQVMAEFCRGGDFRILLEDGLGGLLTYTLDDMLPVRFECAPPRLTNQ